MGSTQRSKDTGRGVYLSPSQNSVSGRLLKENLGLTCAEKNRSVGIRSCRGPWGLHLAWESPVKLLWFCDSTCGKEGHLLLSVEGLKCYSWPLGESFCTVSYLPESSQGLFFFVCYWWNKCQHAWHCLCAVPMPPALDCRLQWLHAMLLE